MDISRHFQFAASIVAFFVAVYCIKVPTTFLPTIDELVASGALEDVSSVGKDNLTLELERMASQSQVDDELAQMRLELGSGGNPAAIEGDKA